VPLLKKFRFDEKSMTNPRHVFCKNPGAVSNIDSGLLKINDR